MWEHRYLKRIDLRTLPIILGIMWMSLLLVSSVTGTDWETGDFNFFSPIVKKQIRWFMIGWGVYFFCAGIDFRYLKKWCWPLYGLIIFFLIGLFFTSPIQNVQRWYQIPFLGMEFQPSEYAKLVLVLTLSCFLEGKRERELQSVKTAIQALLMVLIPFVLILKQPDLGSALVLYPIALVMFYFGGIKKSVITLMTFFALSAIIFVSLTFLDILSHEKLKPYATLILKEYQYERLNPNTYHQKAAQAAIAIGGMHGVGWHKSEFTGHEWLPAPYTDSVFAVFGEEFGVIGIFLMLLFFLLLIYFSIQIVAAASDPFGRLLSAGMTVYLAMHVVVNMGMMCGFLPITGVPLLLVSYGGSSVLSTMMALGILQSVYTRRFRF